MTHGDKKAKAGKTSQASGKKSTSKASPKAAGKAGSKKSLPVKPGKKQESGGKAKGAAAKAAATKAAAPKSVSAKAVAAKGSPSSTKASDESRPKARPAAGDAPVFTNAIIAAAFKRALKKYPNAFRRLTD